METPETIEMNESDYFIHTTTIGSGMNLEVMLEKLWSRLESPADEERVAIFAEDSELHMMPEVSEPVITAFGQVLARTDDPPHIRVYAWSLVNLHPGKHLPVDIDCLAHATKITKNEAGSAIERLCREGDLIRSKKGFRLIIQYH